jgi:hypothetical protein
LQPAGSSIKEIGHFAIRIHRSTYNSRLQYLVDCGNALHIGRKISAHQIEKVLLQVGFNAG